jgi:hypothetical protein
VYCLIICLHYLFSVAIVRRQDFENLQELDFSAFENLQELDFSAFENLQELDF